MVKLSVHLVAWNGVKYIPYALASLRAQTYKDWELLVIDNNSTDGTADRIEQELLDFPVAARVIRNEKNLGFAGGHNQAVRQVSGVRCQVSEYIQLYNQDIILAPDYLEKVVEMMDERSESGAGQGLLLRWVFNTNTHTDVVDTMGLKILRNRRVVDWRTGESLHSVISTKRAERAHGEISHATMTHGVRSLDSARDDEGEMVEVFGVSGALPIYRRKAIEDVMYEGKMFDEDFFMYKEDVDLAFRLRAAGWKAYVVPDARAWHDRTAAGPRKTSDRAALKNRQTKSAFINYHSYKNHLMVLLKNEHCANFVKDWPVVLWYELKKLGYLLFTDWATLKGLREVCRLWKRTMEKRKFIMQRYRVRPVEMRRWFL